MDLRIIVTTSCDRECALCCNKYLNESDFSVYSAKEINEIILSAEYENISITGGEPLIYDSWVNQIELVGPANFYLYTSVVQFNRYFDKVFEPLMGVTMSLHKDTTNEELKDVFAFGIMLRYYYNVPSLRLKVDKELFSGPFEFYEEEKIDRKLFKQLFQESPWDVSFFKMIPDCPIPQNEELIYWNGK